MFPDEVSNYERKMPKYIQLFCQILLIELIQGLPQCRSLKIIASAVVERFATCPYLLTEQRVVSSSVSSFNLQTTGVMSMDADSTDAMPHLLQPLNCATPLREK